MLPLGEIAERLTNALADDVAARATRANLVNRTAGGRTAGRHRYLCLVLSARAQSAGRLPSTDSAWSRTVTSRTRYRSCTTDRLAGRSFNRLSERMDSLHWQTADKAGTGDRSRKHAADPLGGLYVHSGRLDQGAGIRRTVEFISGLQRRGNRTTSEN